MNSNPQVSIIMPSYNVAPYISEALNSVFAQTYSEFEIIVINDGSPDTPELKEALAPYLEKVIYVEQENKGLPGARNVGLQIARSKLIAQLDPDDAWFPNFLDVQLGIMCKRPSLDVLYSDAVIFGGSADDGRTLMELSPSSGKVTFESLVSQRCTVFTCVTANRHALIRAGGYDQQLAASEDFDIWLRVAKTGGQIDYNPQILARYRRRPDSLSADPVRMYNSILQVLEKAEVSLHLTPGELQAVTETKAKFRAFQHLNEGKVLLRAGDTSLAINHLSKANSHFNQVRLSVFIQLLRIAPRIAKFAFCTKERLWTD